MGKGPIRVELEHHVLPTPGGGSRATMRVLGAAAAPLQPYRFLASAALRNLVTQESPASQAGRVAEGVATFPFVFAPSYGAAGRPFGVSPRTTGVEVSSTWLHVRYGHWRLMTPRSNITSTTVTGDFSFAKTAGPPHLSFADQGVSFTTTETAPCAWPFATRSWRSTRRARSATPGATLAVTDCEGLAAALDLPL